MMDSQMDAEKYEHILLDRDYLAREVSKEKILDWRPLGLKLNMEETVLNEIQDRWADPVRCSVEMIDEWAKGSEEACYLKLACALRDVDRGELAQRIAWEKRLEKPEQFKSTKSEYSAKVFKDKAKLEDALDKLLKDNNEKKSKIEQTTERIQKFQMKRSKISQQLDETFATRNAIQSSSQSGWLASLDEKIEKLQEKMKFYDEMISKEEAEKKKVEEDKEIIEEDIEEHHILIKDLEKTISNELPNSIRLVIKEEGLAKARMNFMMTLDIMKKYEEINKLRDDVKSFKKDLERENDRIKKLKEIIKHQKALIADLTSQMNEKLKPKELSAEERQQISDAYTKQINDLKNDLEESNKQYEDLKKQQEQEEAEQQRAYDYIGETVCDHHESICNYCKKFISLQEQDSSIVVL